ncbi:MAG TPA: histidine phosphatase family protein [Gaiellaceae bacterium]
MTLILLARHGETDWNREQRFQGHADPPLNELGRAQARELAERLAPESLAAVYASPLRRAFETAEIVAGHRGLAVRSDEGLSEVDLGSWSGLTRLEVEARFPDGYRRWLEYGLGWTDGESYDELGERVIAALAGIARAHDDVAALAVTHGGPIRSAVARAHGLSFAEARRALAIVENCGVVRLAIDGDRFELVD